MAIYPPRAKDWRMWDWLKASKAAVSKSQIVSPEYLYFEYLCFRLKTEKDFDSLDFNFQPFCRFTRPFVFWNHQKGVIHKFSFGYSFY